MILLALSNIQKIKQMTQSALQKIQRNQKKGLNIQDNGNIIKNQAEENKYGLMVQFTRAIGYKIKLMEKED